MFALIPGESTASNTTVTDESLHILSEAPKAQIDNSIESNENSWFFTFHSNYDWALILAVLAIAGHIFNFFYGRNKRISTIVDSYWHQQIMYPIFVKPLISFIEESSARFMSLQSCTDKSEYKRALLEFQDNESILFYRFSVIDEKLKISIEEYQEIMEDLTDSVALHCHANNPTPTSNANNLSSVECSKFHQVSFINDQLFEALSSILNHLVEKHRSNL